MADGLASRPEARAWYARVFRLLARAEPDVLARHALAEAFVMAEVAREGEDPARWATPARAVAQHRREVAAVYREGYGPAGELDGGGRSDGT